MVRITEELVRKRAEHNESEIFSLEEITLHQENIEKIEHLDKWCRELKILYLHNNLIPKIENVSRMKKLEYLNLTLNNILKIENLEGCESLEKLDLTVNFVAELTSVKNLKDNYNLKHLYLTGNPCADYEGYREYVIATLPQLQSLDGRDIAKSERILALQNFADVKQKIILQQMEKLGNKIEPSSGESSEDDEDSDYSQDKEERFWNKPSKFTPESRVRVYKHIEKQKRREEKRELDKKPKKREPKLFAKDGRPLCSNRANLSFTFLEDEEKNAFILDLAIYKYLDTSLIDIDVQPNYVRVIVKGKVFQLALQEEVLTSSSTTQRSQTTGHLLITMPKAKQVIKKRKVLEKPEPKDLDKKEKSKREYLEVTGSTMDQLDKITLSNTKNLTTPLLFARKQPVERPNPENFIDDPDVPPLI